MPALKNSYLKILSLDSDQLSMVSRDQVLMPSHTLSARIKRMNELKNEISDLKRQLKAIISENKILKKLQQRHMKALITFEGEEGSLSQLFIRHNNEVRNIKELLRNSEMQGHSTSRNLTETNLELLRTKNILQKLEKLSENKHLAERNELIQQLSIITDKLDSKEKKIQELEKCKEVNNTFFTNQLAAETRKTAEAEEFTKILKMEVYLLKQKILEKEKELDITNIYAKHIRQIQKKDALPFQKKELQKEKRCNKLEGEKQTNTSERNTNKINQEAQTATPKKDPDEENKIQLWIHEKTRRKNKGYENCEHKEGVQQLQGENKICKNLGNNYSKLSNASSYEPTVYSLPRRHRLTEPKKNLYLGLPAYDLSQTTYIRSRSMHLRGESELESATCKSVSRKKTQS